MTLLQRAKSIFVLLDRRLKLLNVLGPAFSERSLSLPIPLLAFLGRCVDLKKRLNLDQWRGKNSKTYGFSSTFALLRLSGRLLSGLVAAVGLWGRLHGTRGPIAGNIDLRISSNMVVKTGAAASSIIVGHLQVPGETTKQQLQIAKAS
jgi:hypothetical protein